MLINIIDYRGTDTPVNAQGETLREHRTRYFERMQDDFYLWQQHGHRMVCFTQHPDDQCFEGFDIVVEIAPGTCDQSRRAVFEYHRHQNLRNWEWMGVWDNDATLYWNRLRSAEVPAQLDHICEQAWAQGIAGWVPFNPQQAPYQTVDLASWTFKPTIHLKGTMMFVHNSGVEYDDTFAYHGGDVRYAIECTRQGLKCAQLEQAAVNELVTDKSTVFDVREYRAPYREPGAKANPLGMTKWDSTQARRERLQQHYAHIEATTGRTIKQWQQAQRSLWNTPHTQFDQLFDSDD